MGDSLTSPSKSTRRSVLLKGIEIFAGPIMVAYITTRLTLRREEKHVLTVAISRSDNGTDDSFGTFNEVTILMGTEVAATPGIAPSEFDYGAIIRNDGDFSERNVVIDFWFDLSSDQVKSLSSVSFDASSQYLFRSIVPVQSADTGYHYQLNVPRMNPDESVSISSKWSGEVRMNLEVSSDEVSTSAVEQ